ncbi:FHA domain-containing protein [Undibacterium arcticum]|uniref:FHA domain-containing protein n=1 Tax=Undibacterium arcticum TaxID=1762892 RepID=UPI0036223F62
MTLGGKVLQELALGHGRISIGRRPNNDIVLDNLAISGEHAVIVTVAHDSVLEDLHSTNGTLVNGQPVKKHFLQNNDVIELAKYRIKYLSELSELQHEQAVQQVDAAVPGADAMPATGLLATITVLNGASAGKQLVLSKVLTTLGRAGVQVAVISRRQQGYFLSHVEGASTPLVNGQSIGTQTESLADGDVIELSGTTMQFSVKDATSN